MTPVKKRLLGWLTTGKGRMDINTIKSKTRRETEMARGDLPQKGRKTDGKCVFFELQLQLQLQFPLQPPVPRPLFSALVLVNLQRGPLGVDRVGECRVWRPLFWLIRRMGLFLVCAF